MDPDGPENCMKPIKTILVPVDLSRCAFEVLTPEALAWAHTCGATLHLLHVLDPPMGYWPAQRLDAQEQALSPRECLARQASALMAPMVAHAQAAGVDAQLHVVFGAPERVILQQASELGADLIVMGTRGRDGLQRWLIGSVAEVVLRRATVPVLVMRTIHKPTCTASSCATCASGTFIEDRLTIIPG